jgi:hypothetical protein
VPVSALASELLALVLELLALALALLALASVLLALALELALALASARQCKRNYAPHFVQKSQNGLQHLPCSADRGQLPDLDIDQDNTANCICKCKHGPH